MTDIIKAAADRGLITPESVVRSLKQEVCTHPKEYQIYQPEEYDTNVRESLYCEICNADLPIPEELM